MYFKQWKHLRNWAGFCCCYLEIIMLLFFWSNLHAFQSQTWHAWAHVPVEEILGTAITITSSNFNFSCVETSLVCDFFLIGSETNLNDNVFCKCASLPQQCPWKIPHLNNLTCSALKDTLPFCWKLFFVCLFACLFVLNNSACNMLSAGT